MKLLLTILILGISLGIQAQDNINPHRPFCDTYKVYHENPNYVEIHENGVIQQSGYIINGLLEGEWKEFDSNGNLTANANYKDGKKHGDWKLYDKQGNLQYHIMYHQGKKISARDLSALSNLVNN